MSQSDYNFYTYSQTYEPSNNFLNYLTVYDLSVNSAKTCANLALGNKSGFYILTDFSNNNDTELPTANCYYSTLNNNNNPTYSDASYNSWISSLNTCTGTINPCYGDLSGNYAGTNKNLSLYLSPIFNYMNSTVDIEEVNKNEFYTLLTLTKTTLQSYIDTRRQYLNYFYNYIDMSTDNESISYERFNATQGAAYETTMNQYATELEELMFQLNREFKSLLQTMEKINNIIKIRYNQVEILNIKLFYAQQFFNVLMNKNQGAIGELDIMEYNKLLIIFKNLIISIIITIAIYLYFKKSS
tara:strand:- start:11101 stop:11997 length:897 start_codon:yes stop_codon:yes gene_type:complete